MLCLVMQCHNMSCYTVICVYYVMYEYVIICYIKPCYIMHRTSYHLPLCHSHKSRSFSTLHHDPSLQVYHIISLSTPHHHHHPFLQVYHIISQLLTMILHFRSIISSLSQLLTIIRPFRSTISVETVHDTCMRERTTRIRSRQHSVLT